LDLEFGIPFASRFGKVTETLKTTLLILATALGFLTSADAQNLLVNGDFETGQLTPWIGGTVSADPSGGVFATTAGTLTQTVATTAGKRYFVSADILLTGGFPGNASIAAKPSAGGAADGTRTVNSVIGTADFIHASLLFTASSASTDIALSIVPLPGFATSITVDDATMFEVTASKLTGKYSGNNVITLSLTNPDLTNKVSRKVSAVITEENRIYILDGAQAIFSGVILNEGPFDLSSVFNLQAAGTAKIRGKRIELEFNTNNLPAADTAGMPIPNVVANKIVLTRK